ncbi:MAG: peptide chain release factor N(5)-glutamine methyltransferase [Clostridiales Family XIII bacterium]|jgi:release factor glutamine methyltransferase|nr:peptide chain release factor N(5)-glutamine methyltransferase [Clostridiales Family XIII bacterium]
MTIKELIPICEGILRSGGVEEFKNDAETLLGFVLGFSKKKIFMNWTYRVESEYCDRYFDLANMRAAGMPLQYITGKQYFMEHELDVTEDVLIPRQDTERIVEIALDTIANMQNVKNVLDLCTGSGAIAISLAFKYSKLKFLGTDISPKAIKVAKANAGKNKVYGNTNFIESDLFSDIKSGAFGKKFELIVSNPPYIRTEEIPLLQREVQHEPRMALDGGSDGLAYYRRIATECKPYIKKGTVILLEVGYDQAKEVCGILRDSGFSAFEIHKDYGGFERVVKARFEQS